MRNDSNGELLGALKALANPLRLQILSDLRHPAALFPPQQDGDFEIEGVCADYIRERLGIAAATASRHLAILRDAKLVIATRKKGWTFYRRNEAQLNALVVDLAAELAGDWS